MTVSQRHMSFIYRKALDAYKRYPGIELDEYVSAGWIAANRVIEMHSDKSEHEIDHLMNARLVGAMADTMRTYDLASRNFRKTREFECESLDRMENYEPSYEVEIEDLVLLTSIRRVIEQLKSERLRYVMISTINGVSQDVIAKHLNVCAPRISQLKSQGVREIRKALFS